MLKRYYNQYRPGMLMFAPDTGGSPGGVAAAESPTGMDIPVATPPSTGAQPVQPVPDTGRTSRTISATEALGLSEPPRETLEQFTGKLKSEVNKNLTPLPPKKKQEKPAAPAETPEAKTAREEAAAQAKAEADRKAAESAAPKKITYKGKDYSEEEFTAMMEELEKKATATKEEPAKPAPQAEETPEAKAARETAEASTRRSTEDLDRQFVEARVASGEYGVTEEEMDSFLAGGEEGVRAAHSMLARHELGMRKWVERTMNPILAQLSPVIHQQEQITRYQAEQSFFSKPEFADLAPRRDMVRRISNALAAQHPREVSAMTQEQFDHEVAAQVRGFLKDMGVESAPAAAAPVAAAPVAAAPAAPAARKERPAPPTGQLGGNGAPVAGDFQKSAAMSLRDI